MSNVVPIKAGWEADDPYDPHRFYVRATDSAGHSAYPRFRCPPHIYDRISALVASKAIPAYTTPHDVIRDAIVHRLHWLEEHLPDIQLRDDISNAVAYETQRQQAEAYLRVLEEHESYLTACRKAAEHAIRIGDDEGLKALIETMRSAAETMRDPFRSQVLATVTSIESRDSDS